MNRRTTTTAAVAVAAALLALSSAPAQAQDTQDYTLDFELFRPPPDAYGYLGMPSAATLGHLQVGASFWGNYSNDPVVLVYEGERTAPNSAIVAGDDGDGVVDDRFTGNAQVGIGLSRYFSFTVDIPLVLWQDGYSLDGIDSPLAEPQELTSAGVGDIRVQPKLVALDRDRAPIGLAIAVPVGLPTGSGSSFFGESAVTLSPHLVAEFSNGSIRDRDYTVRGAVMGGYRVRDQARLRDVRIANEALYGASLAFHPAPIVELLVEARGSVAGDRSSQNPAEVLGGVKFLVGRYINFSAGGGAGILPGVGAPDYRAVFGLSVAPSFDPNARDVDKDTIVDGMDRCVRDPEDLDGFKDEDGCPDPDNDVDNIPDEQTSARTTRRTTTAGWTTTAARTRTTTRTPSSTWPTAAPTIRRRPTATWTRTAARTRSPSTTRTATATATTWTAARTTRRTSISSRTRTAARSWTTTTTASPTPRTAASTCARS